MTVSHIVVVLLCTLALVDRGYSEEPFSIDLAVLDNETISHGPHGEIDSLALSTESNRSKEKDSVAAVYNRLHRRRSGGYVGSEILHQRKEIAIP